MFMEKVVGTRMKELTDTKPRMETIFKILVRVKVPASWED